MPVRTSSGYPKLSDVRDREDFPFADAAFAVAAGHELQWVEDWRCVTHVLCEVFDDAFPAIKF
jgi:hypothetical protein